jgi:RNA polymerase sigma factor (sigma-70 family)
MAGPPRLCAACQDAHIRQWRPLARRYAKQWAANHPALDFDDICGAAEFGLVIGARRFNPTRGASFQTAAGHSIHSAIRKHVLAESNRGVHVNCGEAKAAFYWGWGPSLDDMGGGPGGDDGKIAGRDLVPDRGVEPGAEVTDLWDLAARVLRPLDLQILRLRAFDGLTMRQIGEQLGMSRQRVAQREARARFDLRAVLAPDGRVVDRDKAAALEAVATAVREGFARDGFERPGPSGPLGGGGEDGGPGEPGELGETAGRAGPGGGPGPGVQPAGGPAAEGGPPGGRPGDRRPGPDPGGVALGVRPVDLDRGGPDGRRAAELRDGTGGPGADRPAEAEQAVGGPGPRPLPADRGALVPAGDGPGRRSVAAVRGACPAPAEAADRAAALRAAILAKVTPDDVADVMAAMVRKARDKEDVRAAALVINVVNTL